MCDILIDLVCRLCIKDNFTLIDIFTSRSPSGEPVFQVLNDIYDLKIFQGDGLSAKICAPCLWRMLEFDTYKKNVNYADKEMKKLLNRTITNLNGVSSDETIIDVNFEAEEIQTNDASEVPESAVDETEVSIKREIDVEEWVMPEDIRPEKNSLERQWSERNIDTNEKNLEIHNDLAPSDVVSNALSAESGVNNSSECVRCLEGSPENLSSGKGNLVFSFTSTLEVKDINKEMSQRGVGIDGLEEKESANSITSKDSEKEESEMSANSITSKDSEKEESEVSGLGVLSQRKKMVCDICKKSYLHKKDLGQHVRVHYTDRPFKCRVCDQRFKQRSVRGKHELRHRKDGKNNKDGRVGNIIKPYMCRICKKQFNTQRSLDCHYNVHQKKFMCSICGKSLTTNYALKMHLSYHYNERPFSCALCEKAFRKINHLNDHLTSHSEDRPFQCNVCDAKFKTKRAMQSHKLIHLKKMDDF